MHMLDIANLFVLKSVWYGSEAAPVKGLLWSKILTAVAQQARGVTIPLLVYPIAVEIERCSPEFFLYSELIME